MKKPKVALVHDYLVQYGGAERTLEALIELYPDAPIYTSMYKPEGLPETINSKKIITPVFANKVFGVMPILAKYFTFLVPLIFEGFDLSEYDIVISDSATYAKGVLTKPEQLHISYIHTPPRFMYGYSVESTKRNAWYYKPVVVVVDHFLRMWDFQAAQRPDYLLANSNEIRGRIKKFYNRDATIIYPPVDFGENTSPANTKTGDYYLAAGRLVAYKNVDIVVEAFNKLTDFNLIVVGRGPEAAKLQELAGGNIKFMGHVDDEKRDELMRNCLGLINAVQDEDFGIVPIEVLSKGRPVLAHKSAGHLETVSDGKTGMYFEDLEADSLVEKIKEFDSNIRAGKYDSSTLIESVQKFSKDNFKSKTSQFIETKWKEHNK